MKGKIIMLKGPNEMELRDYDVKAPAADEIVVRNELSAISAGTERANIAAMPNTVLRFNRSFGYNSVGTVIDKGDAVKNFEIGDRVIVFFGGGHRSHSVCKEKHLCKIPDNVSFEDASMVIIGGFGLEGARRTRLEIGESGMVVGCGILGLFACQCLKIMGGVPVIAIDFNRERLAIAKELGADYVFTPDEPDLKKKILDITDGKGINAAVEVTGSAKALRQTLEMMARRGRIALTGCTRISDEPIDFYKLVHCPGVELLGGHTSVRPEHDSMPGIWTPHDDHRTLLKLIGAGRLKVAPIISGKVSPETVSETYGKIVNDPNPPLGVLFDWTMLGLDN